MTMSDPIADMLTRIRNANTAKHDTVDVPSSKMKLAIADILVKEGYIQKYDIVEDGAFKTIRITLKYGADKNEKIISGIKRISKPGLRVYANKEDLPRGLRPAPPPRQRLLLRSPFERWKRDPGSKYHKKRAGYSFPYRSGYAEMIRK